MLEYAYKNRFVDSFPWPNLFKRTVCLLSRIVTNTVF